MAFTFARVLGGARIGASLYDEEGAGIVAGLVEKARAKGVTLHLPDDFVCGACMCVGRLGYMILNFIDEYLLIHIHILMYIYYRILLDNLECITLQTILVLIYYGQIF